MSRSLSETFFVSPNLTRLREEDPTRPLPSVDMRWILPPALERVAEKELVGARKHVLSGARNRATRVDNMVNCPLYACRENLKQMR